MKRFQHKNVLITGAASGIGYAAATRIASEGGNLALIDIDEAKLKEAAEKLSHLGTKVIYKKCDVSNYDEVEIAINLLANQLGNIQALNHNAGILRCYNTHEMTLTQWNEIISVNLTGTFNVNRHALPHLLKNKSSYIANTASNAADIRHPWMTAYAASKGGIKSFTRSLFIEYCLQGLHANCVMPGGVETNLAKTFNIPKGANPELTKTLMPFGKATYSSPEGIAAAIAFLLSEDAAHINGTEITIDFGKLAES